MMERLIDAGCGRESAGHGRNRVLRNIAGVLQPLDQQPVAFGFIGLISQPGGHRGDLSRSLSGTFGSAANSRACSAAVEPSLGWPWDSSSVAFCKPMATRSCRRRRVAERPQRLDPRDPLHPKADACRAEQSEQDRAGQGKLHPPAIAFLGRLGFGGGSFQFGFSQTFLDAGQIT